MSATSLILAKKVDKNFNMLPLHIQAKMLKNLELIKNNPISGINLQGELKNYYKYRVGDYRIVYSFYTEKSLVTVVKIEHRQGVYK